MFNSFKFALVYLFMISAFHSSAQLEVVLTDLFSPFGLTFDEDDNLIINEMGTGFDDGAVLRLNPDGSITPLIVGLPSYFNPDLEELGGAWRTLVTEDDLYVVTGEVDMPFFKSILAYERADLDALGTLFFLEFSEIHDIGEASAMYGYPQSNPFSMAMGQDGNLYVVDSGGNNIFVIDEATSQISEFTTFPDIPNPTPIGPPFINQVPTKIVGMEDGSFLVGMLTGFPFPEGAASVLKVEPDGDVLPYASGFTMAVDIAIDPTDGNLVVLQFANFGFDPFPGFVPGTSKLTKVYPDGSQEVLADGFGPSSGLAIAQNGDIYVSSLFEGTISRLSSPGTARVQIIHNAPYETVKININGEEALPFLAYRMATPFLDLPAAQELTIEIIPTNPWSNAQPVVTTATLTKNETYVIAATGTWDDGDNFPVGLSVFSGALETAPQDHVGIQFLHGSPDVPTVDIGTGGTNLFENVEYGSFGDDYVVVPAGSYLLDVQDANNGGLLASYNAHLGFWKGNTAVIFASGLLDNQGDVNLTFEPWVALSNGGTFPLFPQVNANLRGDESETRLVGKGFDMFPNPATDEINIRSYFENSDYLSYSIVNSIGQTLQTSPETFGDSQLRFNLSGLSPGVYFVKMNAESKVEMKPFVIR